MIDPMSSNIQAYSCGVRWTFIALISQWLKMDQNKGKMTLPCMLGARWNIKRKTWSWHAGPEPLAGEA